MSRVSGLQQQKQCEDLEAVISSVHKIAHEDVVSARDLSPRLKQLHQIMELAVYVTAHLSQTRPPSSFNTLVNTDTLLHAGVTNYSSFLKGRNRVGTAVAVMACT